MSTQEEYHCQKKYRTRLIERILQLNVIVLIGVPKEWRRFLGNLSKRYSLMSLGKTVLHGEGGREEGAMGKLGWYYKFNSGLL